MVLLIGILVWHALAVMLHDTFVADFPCVSCSNAQWIARLTKYFGFTGETALGYLHVHLLVLGTVLFLFLGLAAKSTDLLEKKQFHTFVTVTLLLPRHHVSPLLRQIMEHEAHALLFHFITHCIRPSFLFLLCCFLLPTVQICWRRSSSILL